MLDLARRLRLPVVATGGIRYARRRDKELADVLACIREGVTLDTAGRLLEAQRERHLKSPREMAMLFADQPLITARHLQALIETWSGADNEIVATSFSGTMGPPVLFPRGAFEALCTLSGDTGAKSVIEDPRFDVKTIPFEDAAIDIDTPADLKRFENK